MPRTLAPFQIYESNDLYSWMMRETPRATRCYEQYQQINVRDYEGLAGLDPARHGPTSTQILALLYKNLTTDRKVLIRQDTMDSGSRDMVASGHFPNTLLQSDYRVDFRKVRAPNPEERASYPIRPEWRGVTTAMVRNTQHFIRFYKEGTSLVILSNIMDGQFVLDVLCILGVLIPEIKLPDEYLRLIAENNLDALLTFFEQELIRRDELTRTDSNLKHLTAFTENIGAAERLQLERQRNDYLDQINYLRNEIAKYHTLINTTQGRLFNLLHNPVDLDTGMLINYFSKHKCTYKLHFEGNYLYLSLLSPLRHFDPDAVETLINSPRTNFFNRTEDVKRAFHKLLVEQEHKIYLQAQYRWSLEQQRCTAPDFLNTLMAPQGIPNTHLYNYHCLGDNEDAINDALRNGQFEAALEQCVLSTGSLNFYDSPVAERFSLGLTEMRTDYNRPCIELEPNTPLLTFGQYVDYILKET